MKNHQKIIRLSIIISILLVSCWLFAQEVAPTTTADSVGQHIDAEKFADSKQSEFLKFIIQEQKEHRAFLKEMVVWLGGGLFFLGTVVGLIFTFFSRSTFKEIRAAVETSVEEQSRPIINNSLKKLMEEEIDPLRREVAYLQQFENAKISFVGKAIYKEDVVEFIRPILNNSNITRLFHYTQVPAQQLKQSTVLVYWYEAGNAEPDSELKNLLNQLEGSNIPVIIYTQGRIIMKEEEKAWLNQYQWYYYANMPLTLLNHLVSATKIFFRSNHQA